MKKLALLLIAFALSFALTPTAPAQTLYAVDGNGVTLLLTYRTDWTADLVVYNVAETPATFARSVNLEPYTEGLSFEWSDSNVVNAHSELTATINYWGEFQNLQFIVGDKTLDLSPFFAPGVDPTSPPIIGGYPGCDGSPSTPYVPPTSPNVPEPSSLALLACAGMAMSYRRNRR